LPEAYQISGQDLDDADDSHIAFIGETFVASVLGISSAEFKISSVRL